MVSIKIYPCMLEFFKNIFKKLKYSINQEKYIKRYGDLINVFRRVTPLGYSDIEVIHTILQDLVKDRANLDLKMKIFKKALLNKKEKTRSSQKIEKASVNRDNDVTYCINGVIVYGDVGSEEENQYFSKDNVQALNSLPFKPKVCDFDCLKNGCKFCLERRLRNEISRKIEFEQQITKKRRVSSKVVKDLNEQLGLPNVFARYVADEKFKVEDLDEETRSEFLNWKNEQKNRTEQAKKTLNLKNQIYTPSTAFDQLDNQPKDHSLNIKSQNYTPNASFDQFNENLAVSEFEQIHSGINTFDNSLASKPTDHDRKAPSSTKSLENPDFATRQFESIIPTAKEENPFLAFKNKIPNFNNVDKSMEMQAKDTIISPLSIDNKKEMPKNSFVNPFQIEKATPAGTLNPFNNRPVENVFTNTENPIEQKKPLNLFGNNGSIPDVSTNKSPILSQNTTVNKKLTDNEISLPIAEPKFGENMISQPKDFLGKKPELNVPKPLNASLSIENGNKSPLKNPFSQFSKIETVPNVKTDEFSNQTNFPSVQFPTSQPNFVDSAKNSFVQSNLIKDLEQKNKAEIGNIHSAFPSSINKTPLENNQPITNFNTKNGLGAQASSFNFSEISKTEIKNFPCVEKSSLFANNNIFSSVKNEAGDKKPVISPFSTLKDSQLSSENKNEGVFSNFIQPNSVKFPSTGSLKTNNSDTFNFNLPGDSKPLPTNTIQNESEPNSFLKSNESNLLFKPQASSAFNVSSSNPFQTIANPFSSVTSQKNTLGSTANQPFLTSSNPFSGNMNPFSPSQIQPIMNSALPNQNQPTMNSYPSGLPVNNSIPFSGFSTINGVGPINPNSGLSSQQSSPGQAPNFTSNFSSQNIFQNQGAASSDGQSSIFSNEESGEVARKRKAYRKKY